jgi:hypothetical protein
MHHVTIEMLLPAYDRFVEKCEETSREYEVVKTA